MGEWLEADGLGGFASGTVDGIRTRRYQAVLLLADGEPPGRVATALGCGVSSVYHWAAAWRRAGVAGLREGDHGGAR